MSLLSGNHDKRRFRHFAKMAADGSVSATVEVADGTPDPTDGAGSVFVEITDLHPYDFGGVKVRAKSVTDRDRDAIKTELRTKDQGRPDKTQRVG